MAPLVDQPDADIFVGLVDVAVQQLELQVLGPGLLQQALRLGARFFDVGPNPAIFSSSSFLAASGEPGRTMPPTAIDGREMRERRHAAPAVDGERQGSPHPHVVKRLLAYD